MAVFHDNPHQNDNVLILDFVGDQDVKGGGVNWSCKMCKAAVK